MAGEQYQAWGQCSAIPGVNYPGGKACNTGVQRRTRQTTAAPYCQVIDAPPGNPRAADSAQLQALNWHLSTDNSPPRTATN